MYYKSFISMRILIKGTINIYWKNSVTVISLRIYFLRIYRTHFVIEHLSVYRTPLSLSFLTSSFAWLPLSSLPLRAYLAAEIIVPGKETVNTSSGKILRNETSDLMCVSLLFASLKIIALHSLYRISHFKFVLFMKQI